MDALEYLRTTKRICNACDASCRDCPISDYVVCCQDPDRAAKLEELVNIVEKWAAEHPAKTRQSEFLKMFPKVEFCKEGFPNICPDVLDTELKCPHNCLDCLKSYWLAEVSDEKEV